ncbi:tectonin domain-containing protein [Candidatus Riflebacteria bacterium]
MMPGHVPLGTWKRLPGAGLDIGVGSKGAAWCVGMDRAPWKWNGRAWVKYPGGGISKIDVDPLGRPWVANKDGGLYYMDVKSKKWKALPGKAIDIGCGGTGNGVVWCVGVGRNHAYRWDGRTWHILSGPDVRRIDVDNRGYAWVVNKNNNIFAFDGKSFKVKPGRAIDIACGPDGSIWILGLNKTVYKWSGKT